jgi:hypothetical protein
MRVAAALAAVFGATVLILIYFIVLPPFVWFARKAERREALGWQPISGSRHDSPTSQY